jgi:type II secretory ATPase GspE/PulE/Tfp pilus assembly ATPase PilB-like protein
LSLVVGPAGSGKTTVLYAMLNAVTIDSAKVMTFEDPVEVLLPGAVQVQIQPKSGLTFAAALRAAMRSDPDVLMVGEIRDLDALTLCQQAAMTGHVVLSTMHTDDAVASLVRMVSMGSDPFLVADSTKLVVAQRLVRRLCPACSVGVAPPPALRADAEHVARSGGVDWSSLPQGFRGPQGCPKCAQTGFVGRKLMAEVLEMTPDLAAALRRGAEPGEVRDIAVRDGMITMAASGIQQAAAGEVSLAEVLALRPRTPGVPGR